MMRAFCYGILRGAHRYRIEPAIDSGRALAAFAGDLAMRLERGVKQLLGESLMGSRLAGEDEVAGVLDRWNDRLTGIGLSKMDWPKMVDCDDMLSQPAFRCVAFTVFSAPSRHDEFRTAAASCPGRFVRTWPDATGGSGSPDKVDRRH
jgi:hypothetical protein